MDKPCKCPPKGAPAWVATFGDLMSLLLCFFILIVSFSSIQEVEFKKAMGSLKGALGVLKHRQSMMNLSSLPSTPLALHHLAIVMPQMERFKAFLTESEFGEEIEIEELPDAIKITLNSEILFNSGKARLKPTVLPVLKELVDAIKEIPVTVRVEGHTDNLPIRTLDFPSNWELSSARAINVLHYFENLGVPREGLACIGYADTRPLVPNRDAASRAKNRRVEIYLELATGAAGQNGGSKKVLEKNLNDIVK